ncbi:hypothetical protein [Thalassospira alkalitolerans]|uniref:hypothetical protein n=1 Tax=Thalassospira alkalitolerans TaxID=1293890 RepID=UPI0030ED7E41|tara:strand:- start:33878 stop:34786 length:909 start_codon:yes stop_codon:yes gene_type:complete
MKRELKFLHVGHHKCGSTFLQYEVIPKIEALRQPAGKKADGQSNIDFRRAWIALASQGPGGYDAQWVKTQFYAQEYNCISNEAFVGFGAAASASGMSIEVAANRLHDLFGDTNVLIVIRNQKSVLKSMFLDDIEYGHICRFDDWFEDRLFHFQLDWFLYSYLIETYQKIFGKDRVKVLMFEGLFNSETLASLLDDFDVPSKGLENVNFSRTVNPGLGRIAASASRLIFQFCGTRANSGNGILYRKWLSSMVPILNACDRHISGGGKEIGFNGYEQALTNLYGKDNDRVAELTGLPLKQYGYP